MLIFKACKGDAFMIDEKKNIPEEINDKTDFRETEEQEEKIWDMKQDMEDYLEEQGIYIRQ